MTVKVKVLTDDLETVDEGDIVNMADKSAAALVDRGYAEYVDDDSKEESKSGIDAGRKKARDGKSGKSFSYEIEHEGGTICFVAQPNDDGKCEWWLQNDGEQITPKTEEKGEFWKRPRTRKRIKNTILDKIESEDGAAEAQLNELFIKIDDADLVCRKTEKQTKNEKQTQREQRKQRNYINFINGAGGIYDNLVIEAVGDRRYVYNYDGQRGMAAASYNKDADAWYIDIEDERFYFPKDNPPLKDTLYRVPPEMAIKNYVEGEYEVKEAKDIYDDIIKYLKTCYDVSPDFYYHIVAIGLMQSWVAPLLKAVFYIFFTAKYGGGKTVFLEGLSTIAYHGFIAGNISSAALARSVDKYNLTVFADEFDVKTKSKDSELYRTFRQGYRRNNPVVRCRDTGTGYTEDTFDVFGFKACSVHGEVEKALRSRGPDVPLRTSRDYTLPVLNLYKDSLGEPVFTDLFFWRIENLANIKSLKGHLNSHVNFVNLVMPVLGGEGGSIDYKKIRKNLFKQITSQFGFTDREINALEMFFGRNEELLFIALQVCKIVGIDKTDLLKQVFEEKSDDKPYSDDFMLSELRKLLIRIYEDNVYKTGNDGGSLWKLLKGDYAGCFYYPKMKVYKEYREKLRESDIKPPRTDEFTDYLQELDFNEGINMRQERIKKDGGHKKCLVFDEIAKDTLGLDTDEKEDAEQRGEVKQIIIKIQKSNDTDRQVAHLDNIVDVAVRELGIDRMKILEHIQTLVENKRIKELDLGVYRITDLEGFNTYDKTQSDTNEETENSPSKNDDEDEELVIDNAAFYSAVKPIMEAHPAYEWKIEDIAEKLDYDDRTVATRMQDLAEDPDIPIGKRPNGSYVLTEAQP